MSSAAANLEPPTAIAELPAIMAVGSGDLLGHWSNFTNIKICKP